MINPYQFENANGEGNKEAVIVPNPPTLVNKLSANETNKIKDKINEIIPLVNAFGAVPYYELRLKAKGEGNTIDNVLQVGDIVTGWADEETFWNSAIYEGGDITDRENYTPINNGSGVTPEIITQINNKIDKPNWAGYEQQYIVVSSESNINLRPITITPNYIGYWSGNTFFTSLMMQNGDRVGVNTNSPSQRLHVNGNVRANKYYFDITTDNTDPLKDWTDGSNRYFTNSQGVSKKLAFDADKVNVPTNNGTFAIQKSGNTTSLVPTFSTLENLFFDQNGRWAFPGTGVTSYSTLRASAPTQVGQSARNNFLVPIIDYTFNSTNPIAFRRGATMYFVYTKTFKFTQQFDINSSVSTTRLLVGLSGMFGSASPTNTPLETLIKTIGVCKSATASNLCWIWNDATGSANIEDMGSEFVANDFNSIYRLTIENSTGGVSVFMKLDKINKTTGNIVSITKTLVSDFYMPNTEFLYPIIYICDSANAGTGYIGDYGIIGFINLV